MASPPKSFPDLAASTNNSFGSWQNFLRKVQISKKSYCSFGHLVADLLCHFVIWASCNETGGKSFCKHQQRLDEWMIASLSLPEIDPFASFLCARIIFCHKTTCIDSNIIYNQVESSHHSLKRVFLQLLITTCLGLFLLFRAFCPCVPSNPRFSVNNHKYINTHKLI